MDELRDAVESATAANKLTVIEWKATWCGKCKTLQKELERLSAAHPEVEFRLADVDEGDLKEGKKEAGIDHLPVVHFIKDGELVHQIVGVRVNEMTKTIEKYAGKGGHQQSTGGNEATKAQAPTGS
jgi:thioredoxin 1